MKIILTKGLPASGKSTWAKELLKKEPGKWKRVNKDELRAMLDGGHWSKQNESFLLEIRDTVITFALLHNLNVIVDDTNFHPKHEAKIREIAEKHKSILPKQEDVTVEIKDFSDVPLDECLRRDKIRPNPVGERVIMQMYNQYLKPKPPEIAFNPALSRAIVCDIDGTLALFGDANPYDRDFSKDKLNETVAGIVKSYEDGGRTIIIVSGRKEKDRIVTEKWLKDNGIIYDKFFMRKTDDNRKDDIIKKEIYDSEIKDKYNVDFVLDDRDRVVKMWRDQGLIVLQVADGKF